MKYIHTINKSQCDIKYFERHSQQMNCPLIYILCNLHWIVSVYCFIYFFYFFFFFFHCGKECILPSLKHPCHSLSFSISLNINGVSLSLLYLQLSPGSVMCVWQDVFGCHYTCCYTNSIILHSTRLFIDVHACSWEMMILVAVRWRTSEKLALMWVCDGMA